MNEGNAHFLSIFCPFCGYVLGAATAITGQRSFDTLTAGKPQHRFRSVYIRGSFRPTGLWERALPANARDLIRWHGNERESMANRPGINRPRRILH
jgi:hypothetical protein